MNLLIHFRRLLQIVGFGLSLAALRHQCFADDKPRVTITVNKKTVGRPASKTMFGGESARPQSLIAAVENLSIRTLPEGTLRWTAVVRRYSGGLTKFSGSEPVKSLKSFQAAEIQCGLFEIDTRASVTSVERDRIDYEMVFLVEDKELARNSSVSNFAALAQRAIPGSHENDVKPDDAAVPKKPGEEKPPMPVLIGAEKMPAQKPIIPAADVTKSAPEPQTPAQPFDFFNLAGKKAPAVK